MKTAVLLSLAGSALAIPTAQSSDSSNYGYPPPSYPPSGGSTEQQRLAAVAEAFQFSWDGYYKYAFPSDELLPATNGKSNTRNGWGASAVDALSTAVIMQNKQIVQEILAHIPKINWSVSYQNEAVSLFETTIRYLGGMLAGYDLLNGPFQGLVDKSTVPILLEQAQNLANNLSFAFDTPTGIPSNNLFVGNKSTDGATTNGLATIGTLVLEWTRLSDLLQDAKYGQLAQKGESYLLSPKPAYNEPFPGLVGSTVSIETGQFTDASGGWVGGDDSFYEYLIKMYVYDPKRFSSYKDRWVLAADSTMKYLASHPEPRPDLTYLDVYDNKTTIESSEHLACFDGGNFILGGMVLKQQKYVDFGLSLVNACYNTYAQTETKIGPESFGWNSSTVPKGQEAFFKRAGFYITDAVYVLRPEVLESIYYAYRATGDQKYRDWSWNGFKAINATCRVGSGFSSINNVNAAGGGGNQNFQESFWFAEVLKYTYAIHAPNSAYQVDYNGVNDFVFNTEAHPLKVAGTPI